MNMFSRFFRRYKLAPLKQESPTLEESINTLIEEGRRSTYGSNGEDAERLQALWSSGRFPKPSVTFTDKGEVFVCPELAKELDKPGNEGLTELLFSMARPTSQVSRAPACSKLTVDREPPDEANLSEDERQEIVQFADRTHNRRRAPKLQVISKPGKPLVIDFGPLVETTRFDVHLRHLRDPIMPT
jgi:hypothetical protein